MLIEKSRSGVYQDTSENRRLHRVGQHYGEQKQSEEKKGNDGVRDVEMVTSKQGIRIHLNGKAGGDYYKAVAEAYKALRRHGKSKSVDTMLKESGSGSPSKDFPAKKYVEAIADGASHDEAVAFADDCYEELLAKIKNVQEKVYSEGVSSSASDKMFAAVNKWFKDQKFEKKSPTPKSESPVAIKMREQGFKHTNDGWEKSNGEVTVKLRSTSQGWWVKSDNEENTRLISTKIRSLEDALGEVFKEVNRRLGSKSTLENDALVKEPTLADKMKEAGFKKTNMKEQSNIDKKSAETSEKPTSRITFADVPHSKDVNLKKYLTDSRRKDVDRLMQSMNGASSADIKRAHDVAVAKFNDNFDGMKKSERASALYVIMKYKDLMNKAK